jgi:hypothetical protein
MFTLERSQIEQISGGVPGPDLIDEETGMTIFNPTLPQFPAPGAE